MNKAERELFAKVLEGVMVGCVVGWANKHATNVRTSPQLDSPALAELREYATDVAQHAVTAYRITFHASTPDEERGKAESRKGE